MSIEDRLPGRASRKRPISPSKKIFAECGSTSHELTIIYRMSLHRTNQYFSWPSFYNLTSSNKLLQLFQRLAAELRRLIYSLSEAQSCLERYIGHISHVLKDI